MGAKGHQLGRLVASCNDVLWYDHDRNGRTPWEPYNDVDVNFTKFHFNRRFNGAVGYGICEKTIPPILSKSDQTLEYQKQQIELWSNKLSPNKFVYPLHDSVNDVRLVCNTWREIFIIPDIDKCLDRYMRTTAKYFVRSDDKTFTYGDYYSNDEQLIREHIIDKVQDLKNNITENVFVINDVRELLDINNFKKLCYHLELDFNFDSFSAVQRMIN